MSETALEIASRQLRSARADLEGARRAKRAATDERVAAGERELKATGWIDQGREAVEAAERRVLRIARGDA